MNRLKDKVGLVTGAANGIGASIAERFAEEGANLILLDKAEEDLQAKCSGIRETFGVDVLAYTVDVTVREQLVESIKKATAHFGRIDVLVNNAGQNFFSEPLEMPPENWNRCLELNLSAAWMCARIVLPQMVSRECGSIINIASVHAHRIIPKSFPYPVFKHAMMGLTRALGVEYASKGIRVNSISPGLISTQGTERYFKSLPNSVEALQRAVADIPCGRAGTPVEIANTAVFLASDEAHYINAADIIIDGAASQKYAG